MKSFFKIDCLSPGKARYLIVFAAIVLMVSMTAISEMKYSNRPLQVGALAGRQVSMEKLADVFLGMDNITLESHYRKLWTNNAIIFLGAMLMLTGLRDSAKK